MKRWWRVLVCVAGLCLPGCEAPRAPEASPPVEDAWTPPRDQGIPDAPDAPAPPAPQWHEGRVFYEVFVRSFRDSNGDGIGDLRGLIEGLDYLNDGRPGEGDDLEVDGLWLMPIFKSPSYHGYDTTDYEAVDPVYGTEADLIELFEACHARQMKVVLDLVLNHSSSRHPWFLNASQDPQSSFRDYYLWRSEDPGWTQPWGSGRTWHRHASGDYYYGLFWSGMPDLNYANPAVADAMIGIGERWVRRGADGYRVDAARYLVEDDARGQADLPETHAFFRRLRGALEAAHPEPLLVAEAWTERAAVRSYYGDGDEFHLAFDFALASAIERSLTTGQASFLTTELRQIEGAGWGFEATFLSNHDMDRLARRLRRPGATRAAATILLTLPGTPFLYYGDELGMRQGDGGGDEAKRTPMAWSAEPYAGFSRNEPWYGLAEGWAQDNVAAQQADPQSLLQHHRRLLALRRAHLALWSRAPVSVLPAQDGLLLLLRQSDAGSALVAINISGAPLSPSPLQFDGLPAQWALWLSDSPLPPSAPGDLGPALAPGEARVWGW
jgi:alpha-amylase